MKHWLVGLSLVLGVVFHRAHSGRACLELELVVWQQLGQR